jgi:hypothetical protein
MNPSGDKTDNHPAHADKKYISTHRAFVYSACAPGAGEIYAGSRLRGVITAALFLILTAWFMLTLFTILQAVVARVFDSLNGMDPIVPGDLSYVSLGVSLIGIYFLWLWAMIAAVDAASSNFQRTAGLTQASVAWIPLLVRCAAMIEAPIRMMTGKGSRFQKNYRL